jgi:molecular chaperone DnaJ
MATAERDYYELLGVGREAGDAEIKRAFRRLARELHPDVSDAPDAADRFKEIAEAYEVLSNPETRELYDRFGRAGLRRGGYSPTDFDIGNLSDIFSAFFGEGLFGQGAAGRRATRGADLGAGVEISLAAAYTGTTVHVPVRVVATCDRCDGSGAEPGTSPETCPTCGGAGVVQQVSQSVFGQFVRQSACGRCRGTGRIVQTPCERCGGDGRIAEDRTLDVEVPAGIHDGQQIRMTGVGHAGTPGAPPGDVYVEVHVRSDERLARDGDDLVVATEITMIDAALGITVSVPTPEGELDVEFPAGTQPGDIRTVRDRGMPSLRTGRRGDLRVQVEVAVPRRLDPEQRALLAQLQGTLGDEAYQDEQGFFGRLRSALR